VILPSVLVVVKVPGLTSLMFALVDSVNVTFAKMNARTNGVAGAEHAFVFGEHMACLDETGVGYRHWIEPTDIVHGFRRFYPVSWRSLCSPLALVCGGIPVG